MSKSLVNRSATKQFILAKFESMRPHMGITRVSSDAIDKYEAKLRAWVVYDVMHHPSIGKTFKL